MADVYIDLEAAGTGHAGTSGDPWSFQDFQNFAETYPVTASNFYLRGSVDINETMMYMVSYGSTYDAWDPSLYGPWRVRCRNFYKWHGGAWGIYDNPEGRISGGIFEFTDSISHIGVPMYNCFVKSAKPVIYSQVTFSGCSFYCTTSFDGGDAIIRDCAISSPAFIYEGYSNTYINCAVNGGLENNTYNDCQTDWVPTVAPAWDAVQSAFGVSVLYAGVTTPPQPGSPPYTNYTTDLWGNPRTGIGAGLMLEATTTTTTTAAPTYRPAPFASPDGNVGMPPKAGNTVGNLQHSDTKFGSSRGNLNDNSSGDNKADGTENGGPVKTVRGGGGGILGISSKPSWLSN